MSNEISKRQRGILLDRNSPNKRIHLHGLDIIQRFQRALDLSFVGFDVADEHQGVVLLDLLHRALRVQRVDEHLVVIEAGLVRDRFARVFGRA